ncbi:hypothetical protein PUN28_013746 [Cardiocondyla obscurior]|uniref:Uncharacterized protein n=1 Tax=Cardiocondyla obscurior TaxID=286306 RepID=A0AAW2F800_9HYME
MTNRISAIEIIPHSHIRVICLRRRRLSFYLNIVTLVNDKRFFGERDH